MKKSIKDIVVDKAEAVILVWKEHGRSIWEDKSKSPEMDIAIKNLEYTIRQVKGEV